MQAISKGLEKVEQEFTLSENDGPVSQIFHKVLSVASFYLLDFNYFVFGHAYLDFIFSHTYFDCISIKYHGSFYIQISYNWDNNAVSNQLSQTITIN